ncbi:hypothetical protein AOA79_0200945 [Helicobacter pylori]|nr:hypothetical protein AOD78_0200950 [Helicobacter pylori]OKB19690.1 hypothetical protein AOA79_0200945 [Helicobacter pylori]OKB21836.1 hypothetical protein AOD75_0200920 [Helicobacter pylori]
MCVLKTHASSLRVKNGYFSLEIEQNQQNQKKKIFIHGINIKFLLSFFCFYYLILAFLSA